jgi:hypothetical protein
MASIQIRGDQSFGHILLPPLGSLAWVGLWAAREGASMDSDSSIAELNIPAQFPLNR